MQKSEISYDGLEFAKVLFEVTQQQFDFPVISRAELLAVIEEKIKTLPITQFGSRQLTEIGKWLEVCSPEITSTFCHSLTELKNLFYTTSAENILAGYLTGGLEGHHHIVLATKLDFSGLSPLVLGLELPEFILAKGRLPIFTIEEKISIWLHLAPKNSLIFVIPQKPEFLPADIYYDYIVQYLGFWQNENVIYIGSDDEPQHIQRAHQRRARPGNVVNICFTSDQAPVHTSQYLIDN